MLFSYVCDEGGNNRNDYMSHEIIFAYNSVLMSYFDKQLAVAYFFVVVVIVVRDIISFFMG